MTDAALAPARASWAWAYFRVERGEGRRVLTLALLSALVQAGVTVGLIAADTLFLTVGPGVGRLPVIYILTPFVTAAYLPFHTWVLHRLGVDRALEVTLAGLAVGAALIFGGLVLLQGVAVTYYAAKMYAVLWYIVLYSLFWNYVDGFFDIQDAKRLYPLLSGGGAVGAIAGGSAAALLAQVRPVQELFLLWAALAVLSLPVAWFVRRRFARLESDWEEPAGTRGFVDQTRETLSAMARSPFVLTLGLVFLTGLFAITVAEYQYLGILSSGVTEEELATLLGLLLATVAVFNLAVNLFFFNRLVLAIGVRNVALIQAVAYLAAFSLLLLNGGWPAAVFAFFTYHGVLTSIEYNNQNFLFNAIPERIRTQVRTVVEGLAEPLATAAGGLFLFLAAPRMSPVQISLVGLLVAVGYFGLVLLLRGQYRASLVQNLKRRWLDLTRPARETVSGLGDDERRTLEELTRHPDPDTALSAIRMLWLNDRSAALTAFLRYLEERSEADRRGARPLLRSILDDPDPEAVRPLVEWMLENITTVGPAFLEELGARGLRSNVEAARALSSPDPDDAAAAALATWRSREPGERRRALDVLIRLLSSDDPATRAAGVRTLGYLRGDELAHHAAQYLRDPDPGVRTAAFNALKGAAEPDAVELVEPVLATLTEGSERQAFVGLDILSSIGDPVAIPGILARADDFTPPVRRLAVRVLVRMGLKAVPNAVAGLREAGHGYRGRIIAARALARVSFAQLDALVPEIVEAELARAAALAADARAVRGLEGPGPEVLRRFYGDVRVAVTDFILELLSLVGRVPDFEMLRLALRSGSAKERGAALEALEQGLGRKDFRRMEALLRDVDAGDAPGAPADAGVDAPTGALTRALEGPFPIAAAAGAVALWSQDADDARRRFADLLPGGASPLLRETVLHRLTGADGPGPVEVLHAFGRAPFFADLPVAEIERLRVEARRETVEAGRTLGGADDGSDPVRLVLDGDVELGDGRAAPAGTVVGRPDVLTGRTDDAPPRSRGCTVLTVSVAELDEAARRSSDVAMAILRHRMEVDDRAAG